MGPPVPVPPSGWSLQIMTDRVMKFLPSVEQRPGGGGAVVALAALAGDASSPCSPETAAGVLRAQSHRPTALGQYRAGPLPGPSAPARSQLDPALCRFFLGMSIWHEPGPPPHAPGPARRDLDLIIP